jgi:ParB-like chromosome segregation protein Spo0J
MSQRHPTITYQGKTYTVLFPDLLRPLSAAEYEGLKEDIRKNGIKVPVILDQNFGIIDGIHRLTAASELGDVGYFDECHYGNGERYRTREEQRQLALSLNLYRRHLSAAELQEARQQRVERVAAGRRQGKSQRRLAQEEGVSRAQIRADLQEAGGQGCPPEPEGGLTAGRDGKNYPAARQRAEVPAAASDTSEPRPPDADAQQGPPPEAPRPTPPTPPAPGFRWGRLRDHGIALRDLSSCVLQQARLRKDKRDVASVRRLISRVRAMADELERELDGKQ